MATGLLWSALVAAGGASSGSAGEWRESHARVTPTATSRPQRWGRRLELQPLEWRVWSHPHPNSPRPFCWKREQPRARIPRSPLSFSPSSPAEERCTGDRLGSLSRELTVLCTRVCGDQNPALGEHFWGPRDSCAPCKGSSPARVFPRLEQVAAEP